MKFRAVIFDNDNTVVDTEPLHLKARQAVLKRECGCDFTREEYVQHWIARPISVGMAHTFPKMPEVERQTIGRKILDELHALEEEELKLVPGVLALIHILSYRYRLAIATARPRESVEDGLRRAFGESYKNLFDVIVSGEDVRRNKPAPDVFLHVAVRLLLLPDECVVVEDSSVGVFATKAAGMYCIARANEWIETSELVAAGADVILRDYENFARLLTGNNEFFPLS